VSLERIFTDGCGHIEEGTNDVPLLIDMDPGNGVDWQESGWCGKDDVVVLITSTGELRYRVTGRSGNESTGVFDHWHVRLED